MAKDEREKQKNEIQDVQPLGEYGTMGSSGRKKRKQAATGGPAEVATERAQPAPEALQAAEKAETVIETTAKAEGKPGLADSFKEIAPFLVATALGGLDAGFAAQRGVITARAAQNEAELRRRDTESKIAARQQQAALVGDTDPNSEASRIAREETRQLTEGRIEIPESMSEAEVMQLRKNIMTASNIKLEEEGRSKRAEENLKLRKDKFSLTKEKAGQLSGKQTEELADFESAIADLNRLSTLKESVDTGPLAGPAQSFLELFNAAPQQFTQLKAASSATTLKLTKQLQGSRPSDMDLQFVQRITPSVNDNDKVFAAKMDLLEDFVGANRDAFERSIQTGQPLKKLSPNMSQEFILNNAGNPAMDVVGIKPVSSPSVDKRDMTEIERKLQKIRERKRKLLEQQSK